MTDGCRQAGAPAAPAPSPQQPCGTYFTNAPDDKRQNGKSGLQ